MTEATCQSCGEPVDSRQLVCLNCGARVALKEPTPWAREPVTAVAAVLVAVIVIGAGLFGFAIAELTSDDGGGGGTQAAATTTTSKPARQAPAVVSGGEQPARTAEEAPPGRTLRVQRRAPTECPAGRPASALTPSCS